MSDYPEIDRRGESQSLVLLHTKVDTMISTLTRVEKCMYGDPEQPDSMGVKGLLDDHGRRIKGIERRNKAVVGFAGAAGLAALTAWLEHFFGTRP